MEPQALPVLGKRELGWHVWHRASDFSLWWPFLHAFNETAAVFFKHGPQTTGIGVSKEAADLKISRPQLRFMKSESLGAEPRNRHALPPARQLIHTAFWRAVEPKVPEVSAALTFDFAAISMSDAQSTHPGLLLVHPNNKPLRKDLANVPGDSHQERR